MLLKKISLVFSVLSLVLIAAVCINLTVGGVRQSLLEDENAFYIIIDAGHGGLTNTIN